MGNINCSSFHFTCSALHYYTVEQIQFLNKWSSGFEISFKMIQIWYMICTQHMVSYRNLVWSVYYANCNRRGSLTLNTYYNIVVASITEATIWTHPILVPNVCTQWHITLPGGRTFSLIRTPLRYIILFFCALWPVWGTAPFDFSQANILIIFTVFYCFHTFLIVVLLIFTHVTFQT